MCIELSKQFVTIEHFTLDPFDYRTERELAHYVGPTTLVVGRRLLSILDGVPFDTPVPVDLEVVFSLCGIGRSSKMKGTLARLVNFKLAQLEGTSLVMNHLWPKAAPARLEAMRSMESAIVPAPRCA